MFKPYRIHQEQIESINRTLKNLYHVRRAEPRVIIDHKFRTGTTPTVQSQAGPVISAEFRVSPHRESCVDTVPDNPDEKRPVSRNYLKRRTTPAIRCFRCGDEFPVTDFYYTKKTGLCISCWETKIKVA
jgi:hypothetical protein